MHQYKVFLKGKVKIELLGRDILRLSSPALHAITIGLPRVWIQSYGRHYIVFKKEIGLAAEIGYPEIFTAIIREEELDEEDGPKISGKIAGPCLFTNCVQKIVDAETGEQLWPK